MTAALFALAGAAAGVTQARLLARRVWGGPHPLSLLARLSLVVLVLVLAAKGGHLLSGAAGWAAGFGVAAWLIYRGLR